MSQIINTVIPAELYNSFLTDHDATERAAAVGLRDNHIPQLYAILEKHKLSDLLEPHLLHHHFGTSRGDSSHAPTEIGIAKMMKVDESVKKSPVPLLWMVLTEGNLVAYEFGIKETPESWRRGLQDLGLIRPEILLARMLQVKIFHVPLV